MAGTYPNLDASDLETRVRTYLREATASFYTQAEIWRWLSIAAKDIAQKTSCVRRVLDAQTAESTRTVTTNAYTVFAVEYIPSSGRSLMLPKIDPLKVGHLNLDGTEPQYWYEFGSTIGIEPLPDAVYELRLYVADIPKMLIATVSTFATGWTAGAGWTASTTASHTGTSSDLTYDTAISNTTNYTLMFTVTNMGESSSVTPNLGSAGVSITTNGYHTQTLTSSSTTLKFTGVGTCTIDDLYIYKEADFAATGDQTELSTMWQHLLALYATYSGLIKDKKQGPANMLASLHNSELAYLKQNVIEVIPDGLSNQRYE